MTTAAGWAPGPDGIRQRDGVRLSVTMLTYGSQPDTRTVAVGIQSQLRPLGEVSITSVDDNYAAMRDLAGWDVGLSFDGTLGYTYDPGWKPRGARAGAAAFVRRSGAAGS